MAIRTDCPRCKHPLAVPNKMAGNYAHCPRCGGRFFVPKDAPADGAPAETVVARRVGDGPPPLTAPLAAPPPFAVPPPVVPPVLGAARPPLAPPPPPPPSPPSAAASVASDVARAGVAAVPPPPPVVAPPRDGRKVARMITAEAVQSTLKLAPDGQLPQLQLEEGEHRGKANPRPRSVHPAVLYGILALGAVLSLWQLLDIGSSPEGPDPAQIEAARQDIESRFFGGASVDRDELRPYQHLLRDAEQAYHRGDRKKERADYRKVLELLHREHDRSLTGGRDRDLEKDIDTILHEGA